MSNNLQKKHILANWKSEAIRLRLQFATITAERNDLELINSLWVQQNQDNYETNKKIRDINFEQFKTITLLEKELGKLNKENIDRDQKIFVLELDLLYLKAAHHEAIDVIRREAARECMEVIESASNCDETITYEELTEEIKMRFGLEL